MGQPEPEPEPAADPAAAPQAASADPGEPRTDG
jgi:hypothetical protein